MSEEMKSFPIDEQHKEVKTYRGKPDKYRLKIDDEAWEYLVNRSHHINWKDWFSLPFWEPREAIYLLNLTDPDPKWKYEDLSPSYLAELDRYILLAEREQQAGIILDEISPVEWILWARKKDIPVRIGFSEIEEKVQNSMAQDTEHDDREALKTSNQFEKPWFIRDPNDPKPIQPWYTPARYFARQLVEEDSNLLQKRNRLNGMVADSLSKVGINKRGGMKPFNPDTVRKALYKIKLG